MARPVDISDEAIINIAETLFLKNGIAATEMKDIARQAGIGRSSLYRHFESKEGIAFRVAGRILTELTAVLEQPIPTTQSGAEAVLLILERYTSKMIANPSWIRLLDEFDQFFSDANPEGKTVSDYIFMKQHIIGGRLPREIERGVQDGSLRLYNTVTFTERFLLNALLAMGQRIIPRTEHYMQEQGYSVEYLSLLPKVLVQGISV